MSLLPVQKQLLTKWFNKYKYNLNSPYTVDLEVINFSELERICIYNNYPKYLEDAREHIRKLFKNFQAQENIKNV